MASRSVSVTSGLHDTLRAVGSRFSSGLFCSRAQCPSSVHNPGATARPPMVALEVTRVSDEEHMIGVQRMRIARIWIVLAASLLVSAGLLGIGIAVGVSIYPRPTFPRFDERLASLEARSAIETEISAYFNNLDLRRWSDALLFFAPTYYSDYDIDGGFPERVNRSQNWLVWPCFLDGFNTTLHQIGNLVVTLGQGVDADIVLKGTATHNYNGELWTTAGIYHMSMRKANSRYELTRIKYRQHWHEGDEARLMLLALNAAWSKNEEFCLAHGGTKPEPPRAFQIDRK